MTTLDSVLRIIPSLRSSLLFAVAVFPGMASSNPAAAETLTGVTKVKFNAAYSSVQGKVLTLDNVRVRSSTTTTADFVSAMFKFDTGSLTFNFQDAFVARGVGVFNRDQSGFSFFGKDAPADFTLTTATGQQFRSNQTFTLTTAGEALALDLTSGQVLTFQFSNPSGPFDVQLLSPDGRVLGDTRNPSGSANAISGSNFIAGVAVLQTGRHTVKFLPKTQPTLRLTVFMHQDNATPLQTLRSGDRFSTRLLASSTEYAKYAIALNQGDKLEVTATGFTSDGITRRILFQDSSLLGGGVGSGSLLEKAAATGTYYLFVFNRDVQGGSFSGQVLITR